jgi:Ca2+/Na+ antiporter
MGKVHLLREFICYLSALIIICLFGVFGRLSYWFVAVFMGLYALYIFVTVRMDNTVPTVPDISPEENPAEKALAVLSPETINDDPEFVAWQKKDEEITGKHHSGLGDSPKPPFAVALTEEVLDWEDGIVACLLSAPLKFVSLFFIPHWGNPILRTPFRVFVYQGTAIFISMSFFRSLAKAHILLFVSGIVGAMIFFMEISGRVRGFLAYCRILAVVLVAIGLIKIFTGLIIDSITFLAFYFTVDHLILNAVLLSGGNTLGDFFANGALSAHGESLMAGLASFSGQTFNCLVGLAVTVLGLLRRGETDFDIFGLRKATGNPFLVFLFLFAMGSLVVHLVYNWASQFIWRRKFGWVLGGSYLVFLGASVAYGSLSSNKT